MRLLKIIVVAALWPLQAEAHDIYIGIHGKNGQLCCGGSDCAATIYREHGGNFEFLTREDVGSVWVVIPADRITFLPIPGDSDEDGAPDRAHLCYRPALPHDHVGLGASNVFGPIYLYCAFIPPGAT